MEISQQEIRYNKSIPTSDKQWDKLFKLPTQKTRYEMCMYEPVDSTRGEFVYEAGALHENKLKSVSSTKAKIPNTLI